MASSKLSRVTQDFISNVPDNVTDKILELLPIKMAARTSVLSKHWRRNWLSLKRLIFGADFCEQHKYENGVCNWQKCSNIISKILLLHNGPVHDFAVHIPVLTVSDEEDLNLSQWLFFLSENAVRKINSAMSNFRHINLCFPSYVFWCSELVQLQLDGFTLNPPPTDFTGFPKLRHLALVHVTFTRQDIFGNLIAKCPTLFELILENWYGMDHVDIHVPSLDTLTIYGSFESLAFRDVRSLRRISANFRETWRARTMIIKCVDAVNLASSSQLQHIQFGGHLCKFLAAGGIMKHFPTAFNHLNKLCLNYLDLGDSILLRFVFGMFENCHNIKELSISIFRNKNAKQHDVLDCNNNLKLHHLREAEIKCITGSSAELMLIKTVLATADVLEKLSLKCGRANTETELKLLRALIGFPRASPMVRLVCLT
ncbi:hypothetical protein vseg_001691 [Gypsophila vaccaria]